MSAYVVARDVVFGALLIAILIRQEIFMDITEAKLSQIEGDTAQLVSDEAADKTAIAEILTELKAARDAETPIDPARLDAIISKLEGVHASLSSDTADLTGAELPSVPTTPDAPAGEDPGTGTGIPSST